MKTLILIILLPLCSYGQRGTIKLSADNIEIARKTIIDADNRIVWNSNQSDTVAVYMLTTFKYANGMVPVRQTKGYSVTPRMAYNSLPRATYLDIDKKPLQDIYTVWMSVPRKEECTCK